jgi:hypothetical protein
LERSNAGSKLEEGNVSGDEGTDKKMTLEIWFSGHMTRTLWGASEYIQPSILSKEMLKDSRPDW